MMNRDNIRILATDGLLIDGAHHKQWYLEQILLEIGVHLDTLKMELNSEGYTWEPGIAP